MCTYLVGKQEVALCVILGVFCDMSDQLKHWSDPYQNESHKLQFNMNFQVPDYTFASHFLVWLGEGTPKHEPLMAILHFHFD